MSDRASSLTRTFIVLVLLALSGAFIAATSAGMLAAVVIVLILAFAKGWFVILDFMEMRGTDGLLRPAFAGLACAPAGACARTFHSCPHPLVNNCSISRSALFWKRSSLCQIAKKAFARPIERSCPVMLAREMTSHIIDGEFAGL